jgi:hypothetical protein
MEELCSFLTAAATHEETGDKRCKGSIYFPNLIISDSPLQAARRIGGSFLCFKQLSGGRGRSSGRKSFEESAGYPIR